MCELVGALRQRCVAAATANPHKVVDMDSFAVVCLQGSISRNPGNAKTVAPQNVLAGRTSLIREPCLIGNPGSAGLAD
jgi:hypothetical protein